MDDSAIQANKFMFVRIPDDPDDISQSEFEEDSIYEEEPVREDRVAGRSVQYKPLGSCSRWTAAKPRKQSSVIH